MSNLGPRATPRGVSITILNASTSSLKRLAWAYGCAPKGSEEERQLRELVLERAKQELEATP